MKAVLRVLGAVFLAAALGTIIAVLIHEVRPEPDWRSEAEEAARHAVAAELRRPAEELSFRNISFHRLAKSEVRGVCGQVRHAEPGGGPVMDFVAHVQRQRSWDPLAGAELRAEAAVATGVEGRREVYVARRRYCPDTAPAATMPARPAPLPDGPVTATAKPPPPAPPPATGPTTAAPRDTALPSGGGGPSARVVVRQPVNVRAGPSGSATTLRTAPRGEEFRLLDRAAGGWMRVAQPGASEAAGWVHASRVEVLSP